MHIASLADHKAGLWLAGRKTFPSMDVKDGNEPVLWMHCASLGEFEQGRPLLEAIRPSYPGYKIVVTFFSASGFESGKNYKGADYIFYLPKDSRANAKKFITEINPSIVLWVKYEYWFYYLTELQKKNIPVLMVSAVYRTNMSFFKWYGGFFKSILTLFTHFFVQNQSSEEVLSTVVGKNKITNSGDTRFDRVLSIAQKFTDVPGIPEFVSGRRVIVAGSTWEDDEAEWTHYTKTHQELVFIIAPHEIDRENLADVKKKFAGSIYYSDWITGLPSINGDAIKSNCLIIDNIGMLSRLYKYADVCFVGGGFGADGLHNILEAAVYGKPVIFGPRFERNFEAADLLENGGGISINNAVELENILDRLFKNTNEIKQRGEAALNYVHQQSGATKKIMDFIYKNRLLTN